MISVFVFHHEESFLKLYKLDRELRTWSSLLLLLLSTDLVETNMEVIDDAASPQFFREEHRDMYSPITQVNDLTCC